MFLEIGVIQVAPLYPAHKCSLCQKLKKLINENKQRAINQPIKKKTNYSYKKVNEKSKVILLHKQLRSQKVTVRRIKKLVKILKDKVFHAQDCIRNLNKQSIIDKCNKLNIPQVQQMCIKEMIAAVNNESATGNRYSEDWIMLCLLMHIRSPAHYRFLLKNDILPLPFTTNNMTLHVDHKHALWIRF